MFQIPSPKKDRFNSTKIKGFICNNFSNQRKFIKCISLGGVNRKIQKFVFNEERRRRWVREIHRGERKKKMGKTQDQKAINKNKNVGQRMEGGKTKKMVLTVRTDRNGAQRGDLKTRRERTL